MFKGIIDESGIADVLYIFRSISQNGVTVHVLHRYDLSLG